MTKYGAADADEIALSVYMQGAWTTFAKNPSTGPQPGVWTEFRTSDFPPQLGVLGGMNNTQGLNVQATIFTDYACIVYDPLLVAAGFAY